MLLTDLLSARSLGGPHGLREDVCGGGLGAADDVGVYAQGDSRVGVAQAGGDDVDGHAGEQQGRGMQVSEVVESGVRQLVLGTGTLLWLRDEEASSPRFSR